MGDKYDHKETDKTTSPGYWRLKVYALFERIMGVPLKETKRKKLRKILKMMCNARTKELQERISTMSNRVTKLENKLGK